MITKELKEQYHKQANSKLIAVDFDNTITLPRPYPERAPLNPKAKKYLDLLNKKGYSLVLWSARLFEDYDEAYDRCINEFGLEYMLKDSDYFLHGQSGKIVTSFYIDDKAIPGNLNWKKIYKFIIKNIK